MGPSAGPMGHRSSHVHCHILWHQPGNRNTLGGTSYSVRAPYMSLRAPSFRSVDPSSVLVVSITLLPRITMLLSTSIMAMTGVEWHRRNVPTTNFRHKPPLRWQMARHSRLGHGVMNPTRPRNVHCSYVRSTEPKQINLGFVLSVCPVLRLEYGVIATAVHVPDIKQIRI